MGLALTFAPRDNKRTKGIASLTHPSPPRPRSVGLFPRASILNPPLPLLLPNDPLPPPPPPSTSMSAITLTVQQYGLVMPMPAVGSNGTSYDIALLMHNQSPHALMTMTLMICCICARGHKISTSSVMTTTTTTTSTMTRWEGTTCRGTTTALHTP